MKILRIKQSEQDEILPEDWVDYVKRRMRAVDINPDEPFQQEREADTKDLVFRQEEKP